MAFKLFLVCAFVLLGRPQDLLPMLQVVRPAMVFTVLAMAALAFGQRRAELGFAFAQPETRRYLFFFLLLVIGIPFAAHRGLAFSGVMQSYLVNMFFFLLLVSHVTSLQALRTVLWTICACTLLYAFFGGVLQSGGGGRFQSMGGFLDPNDTAFVLLSLFPLCLYFLRFGRGFLKKSVAIIAVLSAIAVILQTGSRGGILGFAAVLVLLLLTRVGGIRAGHKFLFVLVLVGTLFVMHDRIDIERYMSLSNVSSDYNVTAEGGRLELWGSAIDLTLQNPLLGVGVECFPFAHFQSREKAGEDFLRWQITHNSYLQISSETGLIGLSLFLMMIVGSLLRFLRARRQLAKFGLPDGDQLGAMAGLMAIGFVGLLVSGFFLSQGYSMFFTMYFALAVAVRRIAEKYVGERAIAAPVAGLARA